jgi:hypothetical protein
MLGLDDDPRAEDEADADSRSGRRGKGKRNKDAVQEHEMLIRDAWHRNAVSMAFAPPPEIPLYTGNREMSLRGRLPHSTPTIFEEDSSLASE